MNEEHIWFLILCLPNTALSSPPILDLGGGKSAGSELWLREGL